MIDGCIEVSVGRHEPSGAAPVSALSRHPLKGFSPSIIFNDDPLRKYLFEDLSRIFKA